MDDAELVRQARTCIYGTKQTDALLVEMADRIEELTKERDGLRAKLRKFEAMTMLDFANYLTSKSIAEIKGANHE